MVIGVPEAWAREGTDSFVFQCFQDSIAALEKAGAKIVDLPLDTQKLDLYRKCHQLILLAGAYNNHQDIFDHSPQLIDNEVYQRLLTGKSIAAWEYYGAIKERRKAIGEVSQLLEQIDVIATPTLQILPPKLFQRQCVIDGIAMDLYSRVTHFTWLGNFTGMPAITLPNGCNEENLPSGLQIIGKIGKDETVLQVAAAHEHIWGIPETIMNIQ